MTALWTLQDFKDLQLHRSTTRIAKGKAFIEIHIPIVTYAVLFISGALNFYLYKVDPFVFLEFFNALCFALVGSSAATVIIHSWVAQRH